MTLRVHCQEHMLTLRDSEGALPAQRLSPGINKLRNCIYFRLGNRGTLFVRGCKNQVSSPQNAFVRSVPGVGFTQTAVFFGSIFDKDARSPLLF